MLVTRTFKRLAGAIAVALGLLASGVSAAAPPVYPDAEKWEMLAKSNVQIDKNGAYVAKPSAGVAALNGQSFQLSGFMMPLDENPATGHFILMRYPVDCPFCDPNDPNQSVEVILQQPTLVSFNAVTVSGKLSLQKHTDDGLFYRIDADQKVKLIHQTNVRAGS